MIRIELSGTTVASARIATSPLSELIGALELLHRHERVPFPYAEWAEQAREVPDPLKVYGRLADLRRRQRTPDVFHPVTASPAPHLDDELDLLSRTSPDEVDAQFATHKVPGWLAEYRHDPQAAFGALAESLAAFWQRAMRPFWPRMRAALEEEVLLRGRDLATTGPETILSGIAHWEQPVLSLPKNRDSLMTTDGQRLLLVPVLFADRRVSCSTDHPSLVRLTYQCRGAAVLTASRKPRVNRLSTLLGERRAQVLRALATPATTSTVAAQTGLPASTVSEHLTALHAAGAVHRRRAGKQVFYGLEPAGCDLLGAFDSAGPNRFPPES